MALPNATKNIANTIVTVAIAQDVAAPYHARNQKSRSTNSAAKMVTFQVILVLPEGGIGHGCVAQYLVSM
jgi:hypothetical protein